MGDPLRQDSLIVVRWHLHRHLPVTFSSCREPCAWAGAVCRMRLDHIRMSRCGIPSWRDSTDRQSSRPASDSTRDKWNTSRLSLGIESAVAALIGKSGGTPNHGGGETVDCV